MQANWRAAAGLGPVELEACHADQEPGWQRVTGNTGRHTAGHTGRQELKGVPNH